MNLKLKIKKFNPDAVVPRYAHAGDAALDLYAVEDTKLEPGQRIGIPTGIGMEIPHGYVGFIWDKSGLSINHGLKTLGGVIDAGFRGEVKIGMINLSQEPYTIEKGHKVAQICIQKIEIVEVEEVTELTNDTTRGAGGFGSTGK